MVKLRSLFTVVEVKEIIFHLFFSILITAFFINSSMLYYSISNVVMNIIIIGALSGLLFKLIILDKYNLIEIVIFILFILISLISGYVSDQSNTLMYSIIIIAAKDIELKNIVKNYFYTTASLMIIITMLSFLGVVSDLLFLRDNGYRHSLGLQYPTVYAAKVFFLCTAYFFIRDFKLTFKETIAILCLAYFTFYYTGGRVDVFLLVILTVFLYLFKYVDMEYLKPLGFIGIFSPIIATFIAWITAKYYNPLSVFYYDLNSLFSGRLILGQQAIQTYPIKPFGQVIYEQGLGGIQGLHNFVNKYFFIDSSYLALLLKNGWIFYIFLFSLLTYKLFDYYKKKQYMFLIVYGVICINSLISTFFFSVPVNSLILFLFAKNSMDNKK